MAIIKGDEIRTSFTADHRDLDRGFLHAERRAKESASRISKTLSAGINISGGAAGGGFLGGLGEGLKMVPGLGMVAAGITKVTGAVKDGIKFGFDYNRLIEENSVSLTRLLGGADKARQYIERLAGLRTDGIALDDALMGAKRLIALKFEAEQVPAILKAIGSASREMGGDVDAITRALTQMSAKGKVSAEEINQQLAEQGIDAWAYLAEAVAKVDKNFAKLDQTAQKSKVMKMAERGLLSGKGGAQAILIGMQRDYGGSGARWASGTASGLEFQLGQRTSELAGRATEAPFAGYKDTLRYALNAANSPAAMSLAGGASNAAGHVGQTFLKEIELTQRDFKRIGITVKEGLSSGMLGGGVEAAKNFINEFTGPQGTDSHSPSKAFQVVGRDAAQGFKIGFADELHAGGGVMGLFAGERTGRRRAENEQLLTDPRVRAMLDTIAYAEGADYDVKFGGGRFNSFAAHPNQKVTRGKLTSTAAGRYQFLNRTWRGVADTMGLSDFSPHSQDLGAVELLRQRGSIAPLLGGDFSGAVHNARKEWASFPGANYAHQGMRSLSAMRGVFEKSLGGSPTTPLYVAPVGTSNYDMGGHQAGMYRRGGTQTYNEGGYSSGMYRRQQGALPGVEGDTVAFLTGEVSTTGGLADETFLRFKELTPIIGLNAQAQQGFNDVLRQTEDILIGGQGGGSFSGIAGMFESSFVDSFMRVEDGFKGMVSNFILSFAQGIQQMALQHASSHLSGLFGGLLKAGLGALFGGAGGGLTTSGGVMTDSSFLNFRAAGGPVSAGRPYVVGERGPELFVPRAGGQIYNKEQMASGRVVNLTVNYHGQNSTPQARQTQGQMARSIADMVSHEINRGG